MTRISNASVSYVSYAGKMFWPSRLAVFYPHPIDAIPLWQVITSALLLLIITVFVIHLARKHKYLLVGWLWYLVTLVPVIGLVQVGAQALADRYTYVPLTGLFIIISWGLGELCEKWGCRKIIIGVLAVIVLAVLSICTNLQVSYWRNDITLFEHALDVTKDNYMAHFCITQSFREQGRPDQALYHYSESVRIKPDHADAQIGLGCALLDAGRLEEALTCLQEGVKLAPNLGLAHYNLALALYKNGEIDNAIEHYKQTLQLEPDRTDACMSLGNLLAKRDRLDEAVSEYRKLLLIKPEETNVLNALGIVLGRQGKLDEAINHFTKALRIRPDFIEARNNLKYAQTLQDKSDKVK